MTYRAERFNRSMRSLEAMVSGMADASKSAKLSDRGESAARMYAAFEPEPDAPEKVPFNGDGWDLRGTNLGGFDKEAESVVVRFDCKDEAGGGRGETYWDVESVEDGVLHVSGMTDAAAKNGGDCEIVVTIGDETHSVHSVISDAPDIPPEP